MTPAKIAEGFQVSAEHPLLGVNGRAELMVRLGKNTDESANIFW